MAEKYDEIPFFKISAEYVAALIKAHQNKESLALLDVACGTGNVALTCAACMPEASIDAMDIAEGMLDKGRANAKAEGRENITFHLEDISKLETEKRYDVITCSYALFFLPDAHLVLKRLVSLLKKDGIVIFTSFTQKAFQVSNEILLPLLVKYGSATAKAYDMDKWENLKEIKDIEKLCQMAEVTLKEVQHREIRYGMDVDAWWELMNNTGYKGMLMELKSEALAALKQAYYLAMFTHADMDGKVELVADSYFAVVS